MKTTQKLLVVFAAALVMLSSTGCAKLQARDHLNKGVQAYKNSKFEQAIDHFQQAVALDPTLLNARLYLATAYAQQYIPGADTPENNHYGCLLYTSVRVLPHGTPDPSQWCSRPSSLSS